MKKLLLTTFTGFIAVSLFFSACSDEKNPVEPVIYDTFKIETVTSDATGADANPEIVRMVPGSDNQAVFISSEINRLTVIDYTPTDFSFSNNYDLETGSLTATMTSIDVSPVIDGENYVAVCVAEVDCSPGWILLVKLSDGSIVKTITGIGYNPDGCAFTKDGKFLIVACEDDREDRPCKDETNRHGGSVSIIDLRNGIANATLELDKKVAWDVDSEPEHCETSADGTVIVSIQETSQIMIFNAADILADSTDFIVIDLPTDAGGDDAEPDGLYISPDGKLALISNERNGTLQMMNLPSGTLLGNPYTIENDVTVPPYNIDEKKLTTKRTEPEECALVERDGKLYAILALQESHAVIVYDVTDPANPVFDSIAEAGVDPSLDDGISKSKIGSEGLGAHPTNGVVFSANEREGSITMYTAQWARADEE